MADGSFYSWMGDAEAIERIKISLWSSIGAAGECRLADLKPSQAGRHPAYLKPSQRRKLYRGRDVTSRHHKR